MNVFMKVLSGVMALLFIVWAYYQYNDPDPFQWILVYALAALASVLYLIQRLPLALTGAVFAACFAWAAYLFFTQLSGELSIWTNEVYREVLGLFIICLWMGVLTWRLYREGAAKRKDAGG